MQALQQTDDISNDPRKLRIVLTLIKTVDVKALARAVAPGG